MRTEGGRVGSKLGELRNIVALMGLFCGRGEAY